FFVQTNHTRKELLFLMFKEINLRNHSSLHKLFYSLYFNANVLVKYYFSALNIFQ
ncbi:glycerophosphodiester phosphodiesterase, partial [Lactobacillus crispatus]